MVIDQQEEVDRGASGNDLGAPFSLLASAKCALTYHQQAVPGIYLCIALHNYYQHL